MTVSILLLIFLAVQITPLGRFKPWGIGEQDGFYPIKQDSRFLLAYSQIQAGIKNSFKEYIN
jgi:hypothetical protein